MNCPHCHYKILFGDYELADEDTHPAGVIKVKCDGCGRKIPIKVRTIAMDEDRDSGAV